MNPLQSRFFIVQALLLLCGCAGNVTRPTAANAEFQPIAFFEGRTHGDGRLGKLFSRPVSVSVDSVGRMRNGMLVLDQTIQESGRPPTTRRWIIVRGGAGRYSGTLTDAVGNVAGWVDGPRLYIRYTMRHGLTVQQQLAEQPDGRTVLNRLVVYKLGIRVATLNETIHKMG
jgi:hypothetical protein